MDTNETEDGTETETPRVVGVEGIFSAVTGRWDIELKFEDGEPVRLPMPDAQALETFLEVFDDCSECNWDPEAGEVRFRFDYVEFDIDEDEDEDAADEMAEAEDEAEPDDEDEAEDEGRKAKKSKGKKKHKG